MPLSQSPRRPSSADLSGGFGMARHGKSTFCAPLPSHAQNQPLSTSPRSSVETPSMATAVHHQNLPFHSQGASSNITGLDEPDSMQWTAPNTFAFHPFDHEGASHQLSSSFSSGSGNYSQYSQNGSSCTDNYNLAYSSQYPDSSCPRSYNGIDGTGLSTEINTAQTYPPDAFQIEPPRHADNMDLSDQESNGHLMQMSNDYEPHRYNSHIKIEDNFGYQSPYSNITRASTPQDCGSPYPHSGDAGGDIAIDKEQPYAQLIYQALLHADGHTMILRDIYDWFKKYTDKAAASETKGWQNSIRHNLSMNGAFEKVDQPGEESRKGFMWRLSESAIREGVKSTTRYRSKAPNKRGQRSHFPQPQRQASGSKGGQAARRSVRMRRSNRMQLQQEYRSNPYANRSVPAAFDPMYSHTQAQPQTQTQGLSTQALYTPDSSYTSSDDLDLNYQSTHKDASMSSDFGSSSPSLIPNHHNPFDLFASSSSSSSSSSPASRPYAASLMPHALLHGLPHLSSNPPPTSQPSSLRNPSDNANANSHTQIIPSASDYLFDHSPTDSLFTDSPSPGSVDEPRTPEGGDVGAGVWGEDVEGFGLGLGLGLDMGMGMGMGAGEW
ncbi:hypothetical protein IAQ61_010726 [Plenodomus lingam]|nr:hypothetical protein IAQ61_010726 [Plenodomus lingam]